MLLVPLFCFGQYKVKSGINQNGGFELIKGGIWDADALAYFAKLPVQPPAVIKTAINNFVKTLKTTYCTVWNDTTHYVTDTTLWMRCDEIGIMGLSDSASSCYGLKGYKNITPANGITFIPYSGMKNNGSAYINTNYDPTVNNINWTRYGNAMGVYTPTDVSLFAWDIGVKSGSDYNAIISLNTDNYTYARSNSIAIKTARSFLFPKKWGYYCLSRITNTFAQVSQDGWAFMTITDTTTKAVGGNIYIGTVNPAEYISTRTYFSWNVGGRLSQVDVKKYYTALDSLYKTIYYYNKFNIICDGNSLTYANNTGGYPARLDSTMTDSYVFTNVGVNGKTIGNLLSDYPTKVLTKRDLRYGRNILIIWEGVNAINVAGDYANSTDTSKSTYDKFRRYCVRAKSDGFYVIVLTTLPFESDENKNVKRDSLNTLLKASTFADEVIDVCADTDIGDWGDQNNTYYYNPDKLHLLWGAYVKIATMVYNRLILIALNHN